ncbi:MFS transporter [Nonomuraea sp. NPDC050404]|uniref:MFS transporter n=1 Tax=Nonomuraea sp. NPDC050404 TaxID=3155783 RepID=UPI0033D12305
MALLTTAAGPMAARLGTRFGARVPMIIGQLLMTTGLLAMSAVPSSVPTWWVMTLMIPIGAGGALAVTALTALLLDSVPAERAGIASSVLNTSRQIGGALAVAAFGALVAGSAGFVSGLHASLLIAAAAVAATVLATLLLNPTQSA